MLRRVLVCLLLLVGLAACREQKLFDGLTQRDANEMVVVLKRAGIDARLEPGKEPGTTGLSVPDDHVALAVQLLERAGLPRPRQSALTDVLPKDSWMASRTQEDARLAYGLGQELAATIQEIPGVLDARVHVALAQKNAIGQIVTPPSASVLVRYDATLVGAGLQDDVRALVGNAVSGLSFDRVTVSVVPSAGDARFDALPPRSPESTLLPTTSSSLETSVRFVMLLLLAAALAWFGFDRYLRRRP